jgi:hypothetical protein
LVIGRTVSITRWATFRSFRRTAGFSDLPACITRTRQRWPGGQTPPWAQWNGQAIAYSPTSSGSFLVRQT